MFVLIAAVILLLSFVIALISLIREQKKLNKITPVEEHKEVVEAEPIEPTKESEQHVAPIPPTPEPEFKTEFSVAEPPKEQLAPTPFPWEDQSITTATSAVVENAVETATVKPQEESFVLLPRRASTGLSSKSDDLKGTVSLKDLAEKS